MFEAHVGSKATPKALSMREGASARSFRGHSHAISGFKRQLRHQVANNRRLAITRLARPNRLYSCAVFFASPL